MKSMIIFFFIFNSFCLMAQNEADSVSDKAIDKMIKSGISKNQELCYYFLIYDRMAWISSDLVYEEPKEVYQYLGREWFCYQDNYKNWHAIYGKYKDGNYTVGLHFYSDSLQSNIVKTFIFKDEDFYPIYGKCINKAYTEMELDSANFNIRYNHFVKKDSIDNVGVWIFPSLQDGKALYGCEYYYKFDPEGEKLIDKTVINGPVRYYETDKTRDIFLDYSEYETPTLGSLFYLFYYKEYFNNITIVTKDMYHNILDGIFISYVRDDEDSKEEEE